MTPRPVRAVAESQVEPSRASLLSAKRWCEQSRHPSGSVCLCSCTCRSGKHTPGRGGRRVATAHVARRTRHTPHVARKASARLSTRRCSIDQSHTRLSKGPLKVATRHSGLLCTYLLALPLPEAPKDGSSVLGGTNMLECGGC